MRIQPGATQQFSATGDGNTGDVTLQVAWTSSNSVIATISSLAIGIANATATNLRQLPVLHNENHFVCW